MAIQKDALIDNLDINNIISKINQESTRRGLGAAAIPDVGDKNTLIDSSLFNSLVDRMAMINSSHCNCQTNTNVKVHNGCSSHSNTPATPAVERGTLVIATDDPEVIPDVLDINSDITALQAIQVCNNCNCDQVCICQLHCQCQSHCLCNKVCSCQSHCQCNRVCCENDCGCDNDCTCVSHIPCNCVSHVPCTCLNYISCPNHCRTVGPNSCSCQAACPTNCTVV